MALASCIDSVPFIPVIIVTIKKNPVFAIESGVVFLDTANEKAQLVSATVIGCMTISSKKLSKIGCCLELNAYLLFLAHSLSLRLNDTEV